MQKTEPVTHDKFYHIYNRGINGENLFENIPDYKYFLNLYGKYIDPIASTYAWCLMGNHLHLLVRIKSVEEIGYYVPLNSGRSSDSARFKTTTDLAEFAEPARVSSLKRPIPTKHFSHLFNAYTKYYNKRHNRHGSLFEKSFKRKHIEDHSYLTNLILYIHNNPVHHGFCNETEKYPWTSYLTCISNKPTKFQRETVIDWFSNIKNFKTCHQNKVDVIEIEKWLGL